MTEALEVLRKGFLSVVITAALMTVVCGTATAQTNGAAKSAQPANQSGGATAQSDKSKTTEASGQTQKQSGDTQQLTTVEKQQKEILEYGIDSQVVSLLKTLLSEKDATLLPEVYQAFKTTSNQDLKAAALQLFAATNYRDAEPDAISMLSDYQDYSESAVVAAINYLATGKNANTEAALESLMDSPNTAIASAAVQGIGTFGDKTAAETLLKKLTDPQFPSALKPGLILSLAELRAPKSYDQLAEIVQNNDSDATLRRYACDALGKLGDPRAIPVLKGLLSNTDSILRSYAYAALADFDTPEIVKILEQGLRDSYWRVRISSAEGLGKRKATDAVPILVFKANQDPQTNVREAAVAALGEIGNTAAMNALRTMFTNQSVPEGFRISAVQILASKDLDASLDAIKKVVKEESSLKGSRLVEGIADALSQATSSKLEPLYAQFMQSSDIATIIYGIRGAEKNDVTALIPQIQKLSHLTYAPAVSKAATAALKSLGGKPTNQSH